ncbi:hypothetical protein [Flavobacterium columnare]|uniref:hypothetical protein n=1 Tax=Flavobacterium covae TaxID=2906076 RepID=UPI000B5B7708|nr:hypothetical protein B0A56_03930 [Flavobacterium columnare NBRC 100251 = ATCC 23463]
MIYKNIDINKQTDGCYVLSTNSIFTIINKNTSIIETIFWYPLMEMDCRDFLSELQNKEYTDFPIILLIKSVISNGTFYWVSLSLEWYMILNVYDMDIQVKLNSLLLELKDTKFQDFKKKIRNVLTTKNRYYVDELYKMYRNDKTTFLKKLVECKIIYKEYCKENTFYVISNGKKYNFNLED